MRRSVFLVGLVVSVLVASGCSGADDEGSPTPPDSGTATTVESGSSTTTGADGDPTTTTMAVSEEPLFEGLGETIVQLTPLSGGGPRPELAWEPVDGADHYSVYLYAPSGAVYWIWFGTDTSIHVGGEPQLNDGAPGPSVIDGMSWAVMAHDADQLPISVSPERPIAP